MIQKFLPDCRNIIEVEDKGLGNRHLVPADVEFLGIGSGELLHGLSLDRGGAGKHFLRHGIDVEAVLLCNPLGQHAVHRGAGGRVEVHGVGNHGVNHQFRNVLRHLQSVFLPHQPDDRAGRTHDHVPELNGLAGGDVADPVMVHDFNDFGLVNVVDGLLLLVVVHEDELLGRAFQQMVPGHGSCDPSLGYHRIAGMTGFQHFPLHILQKFVPGKLDHVLSGQHDAFNGNRPVNHLNDFHQVVGRADQRHSHVPGHVQNVVVWHKVLRDEDHRSALGHGLDHGVFMIIEHHDGAFEIAVHHFLVRNAHFSGQLSGPLQQDRASQCRLKIFHRCILEQIPGDVQILHLDLGNVSQGDQTAVVAGLIRGIQRLGVVFNQQVPAFAQGGAFVHRHGLVDFNLGQGALGCADVQRRLHAGFLQDKFCLGIDMADPRCHGILPQLTFQFRQRQRRADGICIRILVSDHINGLFHTCSFSKFQSAFIIAVSVFSGNCASQDRTREKDKKESRAVLLAIDLRTVPGRPSGLLRV